MDAGVVVAVVLGVPTLLTSTYFGFSKHRFDDEGGQGTAASRGAEAHRPSRLRNDACQVRLTAKDERIAELVADRDAERNRADALQASINDRGLGPIR
jgi:hypothetical protein